VIGQEGTLVSIENGLDNSSLTFGVAVATPLVSQ
jgi:hypothetical protein